MKVMIVVGGIIILVVLLIMLQRPKRPCIIGKCVLVIGGTSGLGLEIAKILSSKNRVTIASRTEATSEVTKFMSNVKVMQLDITNSSSFTNECTDYDYIFCCPGVSIPAYFNNSRLASFEKTMKTNFLGAVNVLIHYYNSNKKPFGFVMIGSTSALLPLPGYSSYAPSKAALFSFYLCTKMELDNEKVKLFIYNSTSFRSAGFRRENLTKPRFTASIENMAALSEPKSKARRLLNQMRYRRSCTSDFWTYLLQIRYECENLIDCILFPFSVIFCTFFKAYIAFKYKQSTK